MIPTALEFLRRDESGVYSEQDITHAMIQFAKMHCEAQATVIITKLDELGVETTSDFELETTLKSSIADVYPLTNIK